MQSPCPSHAMVSPSNPTSTLASLVSAEWTGSAASLLWYGAGLQRGERDAPRTFTGSRCGQALPAKLNVHFFTRFRPPPHADRLIPLQNHVVAENPGQPHIRVRCAVKGQGQEQNDRLFSSAHPHTFMASGHWLKP